MKRQVTFSLFLNPFRPLLKAPCVECKKERYSPDLMRAGNLVICSSCVPAAQRDAMREHAHQAFAELSDGEKWNVRVALYGPARARQMTAEAEARKNILQKGLTKH